MTSEEPFDPAYADYPSEEYPPDWDARRRRVLERDANCCQSCGVRSTRVDDVWLEVDHVVPKADGGGHGLDNLQALCPRCHAEKHAGNEAVRRRAREFERRNARPGWLRLVRVLLVLPVVLTALGGTTRDEQGRRLRPLSLSGATDQPDDTGVTVDVTVAELWSSDDDNVGQLGRVRGTDGEGRARFVVWAGGRHPRLSEGETVRLVGAETATYEGESQLVVDRWTAVVTDP